MKVFSNMAIDNLMLLSMLPFGTGYLLTEEGDPCENSLMLAMTLRTLAVYDKPHHIPTTYTN
jgi:uncharacterized membrane protein